MICTNCNKEGMVKVFEEEYKCQHCDVITIIEYYLCEACGFAGKVVDGEFLNGVLMPKFDPQYSIFDEFLGVDAGPLYEKEQSMCGFLHRCLQCNTFSYEKEENLWHCPECGFEWEVIGCA